LSGKCPDISPLNERTFLDKGTPEIEIEIEKENRDKDRDRDRERDKDRDKDKFKDKALELEAELREKEIEVEKGIEIGIEKKGQLESLSIDLLKYFEGITGIVGGLEFGALKIAISKHGYDNVKKAMDRALEKNKPTMIYINGILRNWAKEGYPREGEGIVNGSSFNIRAKNTTEYMGFKPQEPRTLSEEERREIEKELI